MKICIVCSAGGHLIEAMQLLPLLKGHKRFFITFRRKQAKDLLKREKVYFVIDSKRNPIKFSANFFQSFKILLKERPRVIISTGAASAVPACYAGKMLGSKIIFIESLAAVSRPSLSGRFVYPIADLFIIQWKNLSRYYREAIYGGQLI